jgi:hypothetical protein
VSPDTIRAFVTRCGAPLLLVIIACTQIYLVSAKSLSPWKGGGFGMFSTIDSPSARFLRLYLIDGTKEIAIPVPDNLRRASVDLCTFPTRPATLAIAEKIARATWVPYKIDSPVRYYHSLIATQRLTQPPIEAQDDSTSPVGSLDKDSFDFGSTLLRMVETDGRGARRDGAVGFDRARVELWKYTLDRQSSQLVALKLWGVTVPRAAE